MKKSKTITALLSKTANRLDSKGLTYLADRLDLILKRFAEEYDLTPEQEEEMLQKSPEELQSEEEQELLKERIKENGREEHKILLDNGLIPIAAVGPALVGFGGYGTVYRASYNGVEVAVKIVDDTNQEPEIWKRIQAELEAMPSKYAKHFPHIYNIIEDKENNSSLIVMEFLAPLPADMQDLLFGNVVEISEEEKDEDELEYDEDAEEEIEPYVPGKLRISIEDFLKNEEMIYEFLKRITLNFEYLSDKERDFFVQEALKIHISEQDPERAVQSYSSKLSSIMKKIFEANPVKPKDALMNQQSLLFAAPHLLREYLSLGKFPVAFDENKLLYQQLPETKTLLEALSYLAKKGIEWEDVHRENLMMRPKTRDIVIIDVGLYYTN